MEISSLDPQIKVGLQRQCIGSERQTDNHRRWEVGSLCVRVCVATSENILLISQIKSAGWPESIFNNKRFPHVFKGVHSIVMAFIQAYGDGVWVQNLLLHFPCQIHFSVGGAREDDAGCGKFSHFSSLNHISFFLSFFQEEVFSLFPPLADVPDSPTAQAYELRQEGKYSSAAAAFSLIIKRYNEETTVPACATSVNYEPGSGFNCIRYKKKLDIV